MEQGVMICSLSRIPHCTVPCCGVTRGLSQGEQAWIRGPNRRSSMR